MKQRGVSRSRALVVPRNGCNEFLEYFDGSSILNTTHRISAHISQYTLQNSGNDRRLDFRAGDAERRQAIEM